eukprot:gene309-33555_t
MAEAPPVIRSLFVTLKRSLAGKPWFHRRIIDSLGLSRRHECLEKPNNESVRGMLTKVAHLVIVESDRMFYLKSMRGYYNQLCRPPLVVEHTHTPSARPPPISTAFERRNIREHLLPAKMNGYEHLWLPKPPRKFEKVKQTQGRVKLLTEHGLYSMKVKEMNESAMAPPKRYGKREGKND